MSNDRMNDPELEQVLVACLDYGQPVICFSWVARRFKALYGRTFHPSKLAQLERLGVLAKDGDTSRGGNRRYYRILDPVGLTELLKSGGPSGQ